jgi:hypothetical protein
MLKGFRPSFFIFMINDRRHRRPDNPNGDQCCDIEIFPIIFIGIYCALKI